MNFKFTEGEEKFRQEVRQFLEKELTPEFRESLNGRAWSKEFSMKMGAKGWLGLAWPNEYGGQARSHIEQLIFHEEMARYDAPIEWHRRASEQHGYAILIHGTEEQKKKFIPGIARGEISIANCISEPDAGSDLANIQTKAIRDGDDYILNGQKRWNGGAHFSDYGWMLARTNPDVPDKHRGLSLFIVDLQSPGVETRPLRVLTGEVPINEVFLDNVRVPKLYLIGEENKGWYINAALMDFERSGIEGVVTNERYIRLLIEFIREYQKHEGPSPKLTLLRHRLAQVRIESDVSRLLSYRVAWIQSRGGVPNYETSMAKMFKTELAQRISKVGMELIGMYSQLGLASNLSRLSDPEWAQFESEVRWFYLRSLSQTIAQGTSQIHRNIIARRGLGLPRGD